MLAWSDTITPSNPVRVARIPVEAGFFYAVELLQVETTLDGEGTLCKPTGGRGLGLHLHLEGRTVEVRSCQPAHSTAQRQGIGDVVNRPGWYANQSGTLLIRVVPSAFSAYGRYRLRVMPDFRHPQAAWTVDHEPNNDVFTAFPLTETLRVSSRFTAPVTTVLQAEQGDLDHFSFQATREVSVCAEVQASTDLEALGIAVQVTYIGNETDWDFLTHREAIALTSGTRQSRCFVAPSTGTYVIGVQASKPLAIGQDGRYTLRLHQEERGDQQRQGGWRSYLPLVAR
jgi:hypothetical protein